ncbi:MAG: hypothetical protein U5M51_08690 [Emticicia sp.]|nr:hypothetical protein [Emticicia sp.]
MTGKEIASCLPFLKDYPLNTAKKIAFSPSVSYTNASKVVHIPKSGTLTITAYEKSSTGVVTGITGIFEMVGAGGTADLPIKNGKFNVKRK